MGVNENVAIPQEEEAGKDANQYIEALNELKKNSVPKEKFEELQAQNKQLLDSIVNGTEIDLPNKEVEESIEDLRKDLFKADCNLTNLEFCDKALKLRDAIIESGGRDPFLPQGHEYVIQQADVDSANKVAEIMKECIEYANGDSEAFTNELMRRTNESQRLRR